MVESLISDDNALTQVAITHQRYGGALSRGWDAIAATFPGRSQSMKISGCTALFVGALLKNLKNTSCFPNLLDLRVDDVDWKTEAYSGAEEALRQRLKKLGAARPLLKIDCSLVA